MKLYKIVRVSNIREGILSVGYYVYEHVDFDLEGVFA